MEKRTTFIENEVYHVFNRCNGHEQIFRNFGNYDYFLKKYHEYLDPHWETLVYCLMPTHFHFLVRVKPGTQNQISKMQPCVKAYADFCNGYVQAFNKQHGRHGSLFMRSFKRKSVEDELYLRKLICYIHNNPVKDGNVHSAQEWYHSSFHEMFKMNDHECSKNEIINRFGSKADFVHAHIAELSPGSIDIKSKPMPNEPQMTKIVYNQLRPDEFQDRRDWNFYNEAG